MARTVPHRPRQRASAAKARSVFMVKERQAGRPRGGGGGKRRTIVGQKRQGRRASERKMGGNRSVENECSFGRGVGHRLHHGFVEITNNQLLNSGSVLNIEFNIFYSKYVELALPRRLRSGHQDGHTRRHSLTRTNEGCGLFRFRWGCRVDLGSAQSCSPSKRARRAVRVDSSKEPAAGCDQCAQRRRSIINHRGRRRPLRRRWSSDGSGPNGSYADGGNTASRRRRVIPSAVVAK